MQAPAPHFHIMICMISVFALTAATASEGSASCDAGDHSCSVDPASGSMLMQNKKDIMKSAAHHHDHKVRSVELLDITEKVETSAMAFSRLATRIAPTGFCTSHPCRAMLQIPGPTSQLQAKGTMGKTAALTQSGYEKVAALKDDTEMAEFILRVIDKYDCKVTNRGGMMGIVPWFSGTTMVQDLAKLEDTLLYAVLSDSRSPSWLVYKNSDHITGDTANLGFVGYVQIAAMKSDAEMQKFARRVCNDMGVKIVDDGGFKGVVKFYSGTDNFQSYERLQSEVKSAANAPHSWAEWSSTARGHPTTPEKKSILQVPVAKPQAPARKGFSLLAVRAIHGFCKGFPCHVPETILLQMSPAPSPAQSTHSSSASGSSTKLSQSSPASGASTKLSQSSPASSPSASAFSQNDKHGMGKRATLDQAGYAQVANLKDDSEMKEFILRMVEKYDCKIEEVGGLMGIVPWFSGTTATQDIQKLEDTLLYAVLTFTAKPWLSYKNSDHITGDTAKLGFVGYVQVAAMRKDAEMKKFVRRVCKDMNVQIVDEGGFEGMVHFYSGTDNFQSFERLQTEIKSAANAPHSWAKWITPPSSAKTAPSSIKK